MKLCVLLALCAALGATTANAAASTESPYAGQERRDIKALSEDEISGLLAGKGMGFAKAAELNGYPGPAHVLEYTSELNLTVEQRTATEALFASMRARAAKLGAALVEAERRLERLFRNRSVTKDSLAAMLGKIGALQAEVRRAHLDAHLAQSRILTPEQIATYAHLRGYADQSKGSDGAAHDSHRMPHD